MTPETPRNQPQPPKVLLSYWFAKSWDLDAALDGLPAKPMLFADSGAYSAWTKGVRIDRNDYLAWLKRWAHHITVASNLDVIRDADATLDNQRWLERNGADVIPVFHTGTDFAVLDKLAKHYPYIGLGGMVGAPTTANLRWAAACFNRVKSRQTCFHAFGNTHPKVLNSLPWYSADSATWANGQRYGQVPCWTGRRMENLHLGRPATIYKHARHIRRYGVDPGAFADRNRFDRKDAIAVSAVSWHHYETFLRKKHGPIRCPDKVDGMHVYLVQTIIRDMQDVITAIGRQHG